MNILFLCRYNRFRSRVAEALFNNYNKDKSINVKSAGLLDYEEGYLILSIAARVLDRMNLKYDGKKGSTHISEELINWADKIYVVADDASLDTLPLDKT